MALTKEEINRKLLHIISACCIPAGILYLPEIPGAPEKLPMLIIGVLLALSIAVELIRFRMPAVQKLFYSVAGTMLRKEEDKKLTGSTYIFASSFLCAIIFDGQPHISCMVLNLFILGDAAAAIVGISIGRIKIGKKSLEGFLACFILCLILFLVVYPHVPLLLDQWKGRVPLPLMIIASLCIAVLELFPLKITRNITLNDNLYVPVVTGLVMMKVYPLF